MARAAAATARGPGPRGDRHVSTSTVASPRAARPAPPPPARHGTCRWHVYIAPAGQTGGKLYAVIPLGAQPGFRGTWRLNVQETHPAQSYTVAAPKSGRPGCTCPDHEQRGTLCKHITALGAIGLLKLPKDKAPSKARGLKAHAKNAKAAIAKARQLSPEARRHLAAMGPEPAPIRGTDRRAAILGMPKAQDLEIDLAQRAIAAEASPRRPAGTALWEPPRPLDELMPPPPKPLAPAAPG